MIATCHVCGTEYDVLCSSCCPNCKTAYDPSKKYVPSENVSTQSKGNVANQAENVSTQSKGNVANQAENVSTQSKRNATYQKSNNEPDIELIAYRFKYWGVIAGALFILLSIISWSEAEEIDNAFSIGWVECACILAGFGVLFLFMGFLIPLILKAIYKSNK